MIDAFKILDADGDGQISIADIEEANVILFKNDGTINNVFLLCWFKNQASEPFDVGELMDQIDADKNQTIDFIELLEYCLKCSLQNLTPNQCWILG